MNAIQGFKEIDNIFTIREYLNANFKESSFEELANHFITEFGVNVKKFENKYVFKYDTILAKYNKAITHECRGIILYKLEGVWSYHSIPFKKFFNIEEGKHIYYFPEYLNSHLKNIRLLEKKDGSCIQVAFDHEDNIWRASTLGSVQTERVFDYPFIFSELFWKIFKDAFKFVKGNTYIFEMCSQCNKVVTGYAEDHLTLLAIRKSDFSMMLRSDLEEIVKGTLIRLPNFIDIAFNNYDEINQFTENESLKEDVYGKIPEGFVGYDLTLNIPIFKKKNRRYLVAHQLNTGDPRFILKNICLAVFNGTIDDYYISLSDENKEYVARLGQKLVDIQSAINPILATVTNISDKKTFAIKVLELLKKSDLKQFSGIFFDSFDELKNGNSIYFMDWIMSINSKTKVPRYFSYVDYFKSI